MKPLPINAGILAIIIKNSIVHHFYTFIFISYLTCMFISVNTNFFLLKLFN